MLCQLGHVVVVPGHSVSQRFARVLMEQHVQDRCLLPEGTFDPKSPHVNKGKAGQIGKGLLNIG